MQQCSPITAVDVYIEEKLEENFFFFLSPCMFSLSQLEPSDRMTSHGRTTLP